MWRSKHVNIRKRYLIVGALLVTVCASLILLSGCFLVDWLVSATPEELPAEEYRESVQILADLIQEMVTGLDLGLSSDAASDILSRLQVILDLLDEGLYEEAVHSMFGFDGEPGSFIGFILGMIEQERITMDQGLHVIIAVPLPPVAPPGIVLPPPAPQPPAQVQLCNPDVTIMVTYSYYPPCKNYETEIIVPDAEYITISPGTMVRIDATLTGCGGGNYVWELTPAPGATSYGIASGGDRATFLGNSTGTYKIKVTYNCPVSGKSSTATIEITVQ